MNSPAWHLSSVVDCYVSCQEQRDASEDNWGTWAAPAAEKEERMEAAPAAEKEEGLEAAPAADMGEDI